MHRGYTSSASRARANLGRHQVEPTGQAKRLHREVREGTAVSAKAGRGGVATGWRGRNRAAAEGDYSRASGSSPSGRTRGAASSSGRPTRRQRIPPRAVAARGAAASVRRAAAPPRTRARRHAGKGGRGRGRGERRSRRRGARARRCGRGRGDGASRHAAGREAGREAGWEAGWGSPPRSPLRYGRRPLPPRRLVPLRRPATGAATPPASSGSPPPLPARAARFAPRGGPSRRLPSGMPGGRRWGHPRLQGRDSAISGLRAPCWGGPFFVVLTRASCSASFAPSSDHTLRGSRRGVPAEACVG